MLRVNILGKNVPFKLTINKLGEFQRETGLTFSDFGKMRIDQMLLMVYKCIEGGCKVDKIDVPITMEELGDSLSIEDLTDLFIIANHQLNGDDDEASKKAEGEGMI